MLNGLKLREFLTANKLLPLGPTAVEAYDVCEEVWKMIPIEGTSKSQIASKARLRQVFVHSMSICDEVFLMLTKDGSSLAGFALGAPIWNFLDMEAVKCVMLIPFVVVAKEDPRGLQFLEAVKVSALSQPVVHLALNSGSENDLQDRPSGIVVKLHPHLDEDVLKRAGFTPSNDSEDDWLRTVRNVYVASSGGHIARGRTPPKKKAPRSDKGTP